MGIPGVLYQASSLVGKRVLWPISQIQISDIVELLADPNAANRAYRITGHAQSLDFAINAAEMCRKWICGPNNISVRDGSVGLCLGIGSSSTGCRVNYNLKKIAQLISSLKATSLVVAAERADIINANFGIRVESRHNRESSAALGALKECETLIVGTSAFDQIIGSIASSESIHYHAGDQTCSNAGLKIPEQYIDSLGHTSLQKKQWHRVNIA